MWARKLQQQFIDGTISKTYLAVVHGGQDRFPGSSGVIETRLLEQEDGRVRVDPEGKVTKTEWEILGSSVCLHCSLYRRVFSSPRILSRKYHLRFYG